MMIAPNSRALEVGKERRELKGEYGGIFQGKKRGMLTTGE